MEEAEFVVSGEVGISVDEEVAVAEEEEEEDDDDCIDDVVFKVVWFEDADEVEDVCCSEDKKDEKLGTPVSTKIPPSCTSS